MMAAVRSAYGSPDVLRIREIETPVPGDGDLLIRVCASTANRTDLHVLTGRPRIMRLFTGLSRPRQPSTGSVFAGRVEAVGSAVESFAVGADVMGFGGPAGMGAHAEYLVFPERKGVVGMPANLDYQQAAACIEGACYAYAGFPYLKPRPGQTALVIGATGAIGTAYLQLFRIHGVHTTAVCHRDHFGLVASLGATRFIDYTTEDFRRAEDRYDFIFDTVGTTSFPECKPLLTDRGIYAGNNPRDILWALATFRSKGKRVLLAPPPDMKACLVGIRNWLESGEFVPVIDRTYPLDEIVDAFRYVATGQKIGNVVIRHE
jgi:NADPH:quinone reductase-like Zn-dependent oxidoreductase